MGTRLGGCAKAGAPIAADVPGVVTSQRDPRVLVGSSNRVAVLSVTPALRPISLRSSFPACLASSDLSKAHKVDRIPNATTFAAIFMIFESLRSSASPLMLCSIPFGRLSQD